jgi:hypothetical protein
MLDLGTEPTRRFWQPQFLGRFLELLNPGFQDVKKLGKKLELWK